MIKLLNNIVFYSRRKRKEEEKVEKLLEEQDSIFKNIAFCFYKSLIFVIDCADISTRFVLDNYSEVKQNYKNVIANNLSIAKHFLKEGNHFDAIIRLNMVLLFDRTNFSALLMLGYFYYENANYKKSIKYFIKIKKNLKDKTSPEIQFMINELNNKISESLLKTKKVKI
jgi:hypothetical protein